MFEKKCVKKDLVSTCVFVLVLKGLICLTKVWSDLSGLRVFLVKSLSCFGWQEVV